MRKLYSLKLVLKEWNQNVFGDREIRKLEILDRIKFLDVLDEVEAMSEELSEEKVKVKGNFEEPIHKKDV